VVSSHGWLADVQDTAVGRPPGSAGGGARRGPFTKQKPQVTYLHNPPTRLPQIVLALAYFPSALRYRKAYSLWLKGPLPASPWPSRADPCLGK
jgi:hypothetical protein